MSLAIAPNPSPSLPAAPPAVPFGGLSHLRRFTVAEYHDLIAKGTLKESDPVELLEGLLVLKMPRTPAHDYAVMALEQRLHRIIPDPYVIRGQCAATFSDSEPEPDFVVARGPESAYRTRHPGPEELALVIEVSASSLERDRSDKGRIYARAAIPEYWVVNVEERKVEVYSTPVAGETPHYSQCTEYHLSTTVPVILDGSDCGQIAVADLMVERLR
jgi:Uma2 family endonuclease